MDELPLTSEARTRAADLFERHGVSVVDRLRRAFPQTDPQVLTDAFVQAVLELSLHPDRYDPHRAGLTAFLLGASRRVLITRLRTEKRRRQREQKKVAGPVTGRTAVARTLLEQLADRETVARARAAIARSEEERRVFDLWLLGEEDPAAYAQALGFAGCSADDLAWVARVQARLRQRLHRYRQQLRREGAEP